MENVDKNCKTIVATHASGDILLHLGPFIRLAKSHFALVFVGCECMHGGCRGGGGHVGQHEAEDEVSG